MTTRNSLKLLPFALAGLMTLYVGGCSKGPDSTTAPVPGTTVGTEVDDTVITTMVKAGLADSMDIKSFDFKVETRKGEVLLSGFVDNQSQIDRAVAVAQAVAGVTSVDNKVSLKGPATTVGTKLDDGVITTRVKSALLADKAVSSADIAVVTRNGEVQLSGFVNNQGQIDRALEVVRATEGVTKVSNEMKIKS